MRPAGYIIHYLNIHLVISKILSLILCKINEKIDF